TRSFEEGFNITDSVRGHLELFHKSAYDIFLECSAQDNVKNADARMFGRQSLNATDALFNDHRIPREVEVDKNIPCLQVNSLRTSLSRDDHVYFRYIFLEFRNCPLISQA